MAFDMGFNFRATAGFVTDGAESVPVLGEAYPHTYTNGNGYSVNGGWGATVGTLDHTPSNDPRIAGINYHVNDGTATLFTVDLSSGSAPGAGTYTVDLAMGYAGGAQLQSFQLKDTTTVLIDGTNGGAGIATAGGHYIDATLTDITATTTWTGTTVSKTFSTTTCRLAVGVNSLDPYTTPAHFRLTLEEGAAAPPMRTLFGVGR